MNEEKESFQFREVYRTYNHTDIAFIKSLLENNDIIYYVNNENVNLIGTLTFAEPMRIMVEENKAELVLELLKSFSGNFGKFSLPEDEEETDD